MKSVLCLLALLSTVLALTVDRNTDHRVLYQAMLGLKECKMLFGGDFHCKYAFLVQARRLLRSIRLWARRAVVTLRALIRMRSALRATTSWRAQHRNALTVSART